MTSNVDDVTSLSALDVVEIKEKGNQRHCTRDIEGQMLHVVSTVAAIGKLIFSRCHDRVYLLLSFNVRLAQTR